MPVEPGTDSVNANINAYLGNAEKRVYSEEENRIKRPLIVQKDK